MLHRHITTLLVAALALTAGTAGAAWTLIDDFESYEPLPFQIGTANAWTVSGSYTTSQTVVEDPVAFGNKALSAVNQSANVYSPASVSDGSTGTLFFRVFIPAATGDFAVGLTTQASPSQAGHHADSFRIENGSVQVYDSSSFQTVGTLSANNWYNVWHVMDNQNDTWQAFIEGPGFSNQHQLAYGASPNSVFDFRTGNGTNDLVNFFIRTNGAHSGDTAYIDDIYVNSSAADLTNPMSAPSSVVLIDFNNADPFPIPGALWNTIDTPSNATNSSPFALWAANGVASGISIALSDTWESSGATNNDGQFATTHPELAVGGEDYFLLRDVGTEGEVTLSGLNADRPYKVEILSSVNDSSRDRIQNILVAGQFADSMPDGLAYDSYQDGFEDGSLLVWEHVLANSSGQLAIDVKVLGDGTAFGGINAIRLMAIPEPSMILLLLCGIVALIPLGRRWR